MTLVKLCTVSFFFLEIKAFFIEWWILNIVAKLLGGIMQSYLGRSACARASTSWIQYSGKPGAKTCTGSLHLSGGHWCVISSLYLGLKQTEIAEILQHSCCAVHEQIIITTAIVFLCMFAFSVQRASFFAAADENHRPVSAASSSDQAEDQLTAQIKPYTG